jgi:hypothetical protein
MSEFFPNEPTSSSLRAKSAAIRGWNPSRDFTKRTQSLHGSRLCAFLYRPARKQMGTRETRPSNFYQTKPMWKSEDRRSRNPKEVRNQKRLRLRELQRNYQTKPLRRRQMSDSLNRYMVQPQNDETNPPSSGPRGEGLDRCNGKITKTNRCAQCASSKFGIQGSKLSEITKRTHSSPCPLPADEEVGSLRWGDYETNPSRVDGRFQDLRCEIGDWRSPTDAAATRRQTRNLKPETRNRVRKLPNEPTFTFGPSGPTGEVNPCGT